MTDCHDPNFPQLPDGLEYASEAYFPTREETMLMEAPHKSGWIGLTQADFDRVAKLRTDGEKRVLELRKSI